MSKASTKGSWDHGVAYAIFWIIVGGVLRLYQLDSMEFKRDEQEALRLAAQLVAQPPVLSGAPLPAHGMVSSNFVFNAPLFTWIVAAFWSLTRDPIGVTSLIALVNTGCLIPLWLWARRHMDDSRALLTLAITAASPFAVLLSRKIWTQDLLLAGLVVILWSCEWLRGPRPWRGVAALLVGALLVGQLHQSGLIAIALLPIALAVQFAADRRGAKRVGLGHPSWLEAALVMGAVALNAFFWGPYLQYLLTVPIDVLRDRPMANTFAPMLLAKVTYQVAPADLPRFFWFDRGEFENAAIRSIVFNLAILAGVPLLLLGVWRWTASPLRIPVIGLWWWLIIGCFAIARIETHYFYTLVVAPLPALIASGAFDRAQTMSGILKFHRWAYTWLLLLLSVLTLTWLAERGGARGDYGVSYRIRRLQADALIAVARGVSSAPFGEPVRGPERDSLQCNPAPPELEWLVTWRAGSTDVGVDGFQLCDDWVPVSGDRVYRWRLIRHQAAR